MLLAAAVAVLGAAPALAADQPRAPWQWPSEFSEVRLGVMAHDALWREAGSVSINGELVFPKLWGMGWSDFWRALVPRLHVGVMGNTGGKTSYAYFGGLWTWDLGSNWFTEASFGGAVHDGELDGGPGRSALGCRVLYHTSGSLGYRLTPQWSIMATIDHISNGTGSLSSCSRNQGINELGLRIARSF